MTFSEAASDVFSSVLTSDTKEKKNVTHLPQCLDIMSETTVYKVH